MATLTRVDEEIEVPDELPLVALRDLVFFPYMLLPLLVGRPRSAAALEEAERGEKLLLLVAQRDASVEEPGPRDLHQVGTLIRLGQLSRLPDGTARVVMEGLGRVRIDHFLTKDGGDPADSPFRAKFELSRGVEAEDGTPWRPEVEAMVRRVRSMYEEYAILNERIPPDVLESLPGIRDRVRLGHVISGHLLISVSEKQKLLEAFEPPDQFRILNEILVRELEILRIEERLDAQIQRQMDVGRKQQYLQEQLKAIHKELDADEGEWEGLEHAVARTPLPPHAKERAQRELRRLRKSNPMSPEASVIRTYLDWILALPWQTRSEDNLDVEHAGKILDEAHHGLTEVKDRILDHIAVLSLVGELQGPILCLVGPPGVGKTSLGRSIARALGREFVHASLGGIRDEAEIRGHRRTYVGALPGRILQGLRRSGSRSPVFLLDEVDKLAQDFHGDPGSALLEVLDPEQNKAFTDHYLELDFDLSDVLFVATANTLTGIPEPLRDRMEVIRLPGYLDTEKKTIVRDFLWPKQLRRHGLAVDSVALGGDTLDRIIHRYTREAGVRELERQISRIARKVARMVAEGDLAADASFDVDPGRLKELLGPPAYLPPSREEEERAGIAKGLAWTVAGGEILDVEVSVVPGRGEIRLTGTLGDVMKESAFAAVTYARSRAPWLGLDRRFHEGMDIHIHIPEGATPKDGPSAGITIAVALISALTDTPAPRDIAMTGEITLGGRVLAVGGIREKAVAALRHGIARVIIPAKNATELELLPDEVREGLDFLPLRTMDEVLSTSLPSLRTGPGRPSAGITPRDLGDEGREAGIQLSQ